MSQPKVKIPSLGYALLGMLQQKPASGYDLRKIFSSTSMKTYSDSPGAIYPALSRLEKQNLIRGTIEQSSGLRRRQMFRVTPKGVSELKQWITRPITREDMIGRMPEIMLRFAFCEHAVSADATIELLQSLQTALKAHVAALHEEFKTIQGFLPTSGRLAFECGIRGNQSLLDWTRHALATYAKEGRREERKQ